MESSASLPLSQISDLFSDHSFPLDHPFQTSVRVPDSAPAGITTFDLGLGLFPSFSVSHIKLVEQDGLANSNGYQFAGSGKSSEAASKEETSIMKGETDPKREARLARKRLSGKKSREKQKSEIQEAERRVQQLVEEVKRLQLENGTLELKKSVLSTVLQRYDRITGEEAAQPVSPVENINSNANILQRILISQGCENKNNISIAEFIEVWKKVLFEGSRLVCATDTHNEDAVRALPGFVREVQDWYGEWALSVDDATFLQLLTTNMESGALVASSRDHWVGVARSLQLTPEQKGAAWHAVSEVFKFVEKAQKEHSDARQGLERLVSVINEQPIPKQDSEEHQRRKCRHLAMLTDELYAVFHRSKGIWQRRARLATDLADAFIYKHVLTARQTLIAALNSFPYMLDSVSLLSGLSAVLRLEYGGNKETQMSFAYEGRYSDLAL